MKKVFLITLIVCLSSLAAFADTIQVTDGSINTGEQVTWTNDNEYILNGFVFVEDGASLVIEAGTVIKGTPGQGENASALIIARGGKIYANGTASKPIIFTAESDNVNDPYDIPFGTSGLWGGLIVLGKARINTATGEGNIEGIPSDEPRGAYGGNDDADNSGVIRYVSIRHGGTDIGEANEINGLTMGAVGSSTTIEYVEVFNNNDDGYEWFGGTVNCKYLVSAFNKDDSFDYDEGFRGKGQFWFTIQGSEYGNMGGEHDGGTTPEDGQPYAIPMIYNATYIGSGKDSDNADSAALLLRDNAGGKYINSIFMDFTVTGLDIEDLQSGEDSRARLEVGDILFANNIWYHFGAGSTFSVIGKQDYTAAHLQSNNNVISDPQLNGISRTQDGALDPRPADGSAVYNNLASIPSDDFFTHVNYKGAFGKVNWAANWTAMAQYGFMPQPETILVNDESIDAGETVTWSSSNTYILDGFVFVEDGATLIIEPGTVIKGKPGQGENASALIIARGGKIMAEGTAQNPIIFTAESDDVNDLNDIPFGTSGLWGGVLILGKARINTATGEGNIEGIPSDEPRGAYGGTNDADNSGVFRYVSIRHGGTDIGEANEINGLTMGAVGSGTTIEYVEVFNNNDDGYEWFGGTVNCKYLISAFNKDDSFDYDEGFRGKGQFWFTIQGSEFGNMGGEHDGGTTPEDGKPYAMPVIYNATYIGSGKDSDNADSAGLLIRDNAGGKYLNSIFMDFTGTGVDIEDLQSGEDSHARLEAGDLLLANNIWYNFSAGNTFATIAKQDYAAAHLQANNNIIANPMFSGISRSADGGLDPVPAQNGPAYENLASIPSDGFYSQVGFKGAFGNENWAAFWSYLYQLKYMPTYIETMVDEKSVPEDFSLVQNYPNPFNPATTISFTIQSTDMVKLTIYDMLGQKVDTLVNQVMVPGTYSTVWNGQNRASGFYFYKFESGATSLTKKMMLVK
ncbi:MAG: T9SS type A sorting domain-containing protein [Candidatus Latescibacteria bacterium]|nr:T9SS type A sorting domain-containing protein [Candidatus Latescibacterota bacterium]